MLSETYKEGFDDGQISGILQAADYIADNAELAEELGNDDLVEIYDYIYKTLREMAYSD